MAPRLVVGCPARHRDWILPRWREAVLAACARAGVEAPVFAFVVGADDRDTLDLVRAWPDTVVSEVIEPERFDIRDWSPESGRLDHMVGLRNHLLRTVREIDPALFLSLDSDILIQRDALGAMLATLDERPTAWAVGTKAYLSFNDDSERALGYPNYALWDRRGLVRPDRFDIIQVDVLMAAKLMTRQAYHVDYLSHPWGEDTGWSLNIRDHGGELWWDGCPPCSKHVMSPPWLDIVDLRCGY